MTTESFPMSFVDCDEIENCVWLGDARLDWISHLGMLSDVIWNIGLEEDANDRDKVRKV